MANHRAERRDPSARPSGAATSTPSTASPAPAPRAGSTAGKRRAEKAARPLTRHRSSGLVSGGRRLSLPSAPSLVGAMALVVAATGAVSVAAPDGPETQQAAATTPKLFTAASVMTGTSAEVDTNQAATRMKAVSRDSQRQAMEEAAAEKLVNAAEEQAEERNAALAKLAASAEKHATAIAANQWVLPLAGYRLTARFGESSSLWSSTHTGLDFAAPYGTTVVSVAKGTVTEAAYAGSYGNRIIVTLEDGTEIWYCHLSSFAVSDGQAVDPGTAVGAVGSTGNSTGDHLHLEVRPGAGDAVDPYAALQARGLTP